MGSIWILVDGNNHVHRDFHATGGLAGKSANLLMCRLEAMRRSFYPERIVVAFDSHRTFRSEIEPSYKANRPTKPEELRTALAAVRAKCLAEEIDVVEVEGFEADDAIATLTRLARENGRRVVISSADKDLRQLLHASAVTQLLAVARQGTRLQCDYLTADQLVAKFGVRADQWIDYQTLVGDATDNVLGADGIGPQTAVKILQRCETLDGYYENSWSVNLTSKQRTSLANFRRRMDTVRQLVTLRQDVPLPEAWVELVA